MVLLYEGALMYAIVGSGGDIGTFIASERAGGFYEACGAIKALLSLSMDRAMPNKKARTGSGQRVEISGAIRRGLSGCHFLSVGTDSGVVKLQVKKSPLHTAGKSM
jgi:hypothetical protein